MNILISTIPHSKQRYDTVGDWYFDRSDNTLVIKVSDTKDIRMNFLIAIHEMVEAVLCKWEGVTQKQVDKWDKSHLDSDDPGSIAGCPYWNQHFIATIVESTLCLIIGISWNYYEETIKRVSESYKKDII